jgi:hypothetical protein
MNSREKGKRGERAWRDELRANGYRARRGQQFCGSAESPDVVCDDLAWIHFEVKAVERLNIEDAMEQARRESVAPTGQHKVPVVAHRRSFRSWLVTMDAETFFRLLRGDFTAETQRRGEGRGAHGGPSRTGRSRPTERDVSRLMTLGASGGSPEATGESPVPPEPNKNKQQTKNEQGKL